MTLPDPVSLMGYAAALLTTLAFLPQVADAWARRSAGDLNLGTLVMFATGVGLWFGYGLIQGDGPLALANGITLALVGVLLSLKLRDLRRARQPSV